MINLGFQHPGSTVYVFFESFAGATGAPITMTNFAVADIKIYKDGSTTERASSSGFTLLDTDGTDFDGITGIHGFSIDLSDDTTADFYKNGGRYNVVLSTVTVDGQTMSFNAAHFRIGYEQAIFNTFIATLSSQTSFTLSSGPAEDNALKWMQIIVQNKASAVQRCIVEVSAYTGSTKTVTLAAAPTFTIAAGDNVSPLQLAPLRPTTPGRTAVVDAAGLVDSNAVKVGPTGAGTAQTARDVGLSVLISSGSGTGQLDVTSGVIKANLAQILGTALTETAGLLAGGFKKFFNIATPQATMDHGILVDTVTTLTNAPADSSGVTSLLTRLSALRAGYLDNLNIGGNVASSAEVVVIQNNTRVVRVVPDVFERPDSGTTVFRIELLAYDDAGNMEAPDSAPTISVVNQAGTSRDANLDSTTMSLVSAGRYRSLYTIDTIAALEELLFAFTVVEGGATRIYVNAALVVDTTAVDFTAADRTKLDTLAADYTTVRAAKIDNLDAAVSSRLATVGYTAPDNATIGTISTNVSTVISRIGAFTGSGVNTILGFLKSALSKVATVPSDVGGTFDPATDSTEAIRDRGDAAYLTATGFAVPGSNMGTVTSVIGDVSGNVVGSVGSVLAAVSVSSNIKKNQALAGFGFIMIDSTDHVSGKASLTVTATRSIDGGAFAACANAVVEISAGAYKINLAAADLNGNSVLLKFSATGADTRFVEIVTQP